MNNPIMEQELIHVSGGQTDAIDPKLDEAKESILSAFFHAQCMKSRELTMEEDMRKAYRYLYEKKGFDVEFARAFICCAHKIGHNRINITPRDTKDFEHLKNILWFLDNAYRLLKDF